jgi:CRISPR/Cas system-associated endonuclease Cas1
MWIWVLITSDAIDVCTRRHVEILITNYGQKFVAIYAAYASCQANRALEIRLRQFEAILNRQKKLAIARDVVRRKIEAEGAWGEARRTPSLSEEPRDQRSKGKRLEVEHSANIRTTYLQMLDKCTTTATVRIVEAKSAYEWWRQWKDFTITFARGAKPPEQWKNFQTRYIGRPQGKVGELAKQFTARFAETPLQALYNFAVGIVVARITRVIATRGLDPCFGFFA